MPRDIRDDKTLRFRLDQIKRVLAMDNVIKRSALEKEQREIEVELGYRQHYAMGGFSLPGYRGATA